MKIDYARKGSDTMITKDMTLADVVKAHPNTIGFLNGLHLDYCCGGHDPIAMAVREKGLDVDKFLAELNQAAAKRRRSGTSMMISKRSRRLKSRRCLTIWKRRIT